MHLKLFYLLHLYQEPYLLCSTLPDTALIYFYEENAIMRVLIINTSEHIGGAAIAANRLMEALRDNGIRVKMLVRDKQSEQMTVVSIGSGWMLPVKFLWEPLVIFVANKFSRRNLFQVDIANTGTDVTNLPEFQQADIIHLHWMNQGFLSLSDSERIIDSGKPIVITMHDMWYFTGICHYSGNCNRYKEECHNCPLLTEGGWGKDIATKVFRKKQELYKKTKLTFVGCSRWIASLASESALTVGHKIISIPNAIDTNLFRPMDRDAARHACNLPTDKLLILFGSQRITDERKGFKYLVEACEIIKKKHPHLASKIGIVVVGGDSNKVASLLPLPVYPVSYVKDEHDMVELYNAVDIYVTPSLQDNLPNTIVEAMSCGVPCVGFNIGGIPEMIDHLHNGYVAEYCKAEDFANGVCWALQQDNYKGPCDAARRKALATYSESNVSRKYIEIYSKALDIKA